MEIRQKVFRKLVLPEGSFSNLEEMEKSRLEMVKVNSAISRYFNDPHIKVVKMEMSVELEIEMEDSFYQDKPEEHYDTILHRP